jgi:2-aminoadipate transaminase
MAVLSKRMENLRPSPVREMLAIGQRPGMISFAGGLPAPESFATLDLPPAPPDLLQYGPTEGEPRLRAKIAEDLNRLGLDCGEERVLILSGSQQGIDLAAKLVIDPGTKVAVESPSYLAALQVFRLFGAHFVPLAETESSGPALTYVTPTFHNPTGDCWDASKRAAVAQACDRSGTILFEDDPYRDLVYEECDRRPVCSLLRTASWIYQGSFSKTVAPGLRLGFLAASEDLFAHLVRLKQAADLHTNRLSQWIVLHQLDAPDREERLRTIAARYREKRDRFAAALHSHFGNHAQWHLPKGGMFFWVTLDSSIDVEALLVEAVAQGVLFTPGSHFLADEGTSSAIRLNFSLVDSDRAERGLEILGRLARQLQHS